MGILETIILAVSSNTGRYNTRLTEPPFDCWDPQDGSVPSEPVGFVRDLDRGINDDAGWSFPCVVYTVKVVREYETLGMIASVDIGRPEFDGKGNVGRGYGPRVCG